MSTQASSISRECVTSYIDGQWQPAGAHLLDVVNPATEQVVARLSEADAAETDRAVQAARRAHQQGVWAGKPAAEKQAIFRQIAQLTEAHLDELAQLESLNSGLPLRYLRSRQLPRIVRNFSFFADWQSQNVEKAGIQDDQYLRYVLREPAGVAALISPWNAPLALASTKIAAALSFGNCCVLKTAETTPLAVARFMEILTQAGVPPGVVNLINGRGAVTGDALVRHPDVRVVSFTGGTATGRAIAAAAAPGLKRVDLELGGKSANIVTATANLDDALDGALTSIYTNNGQQCFAGSRILLHRSIADEFIRRFVARAQAIRVGDPLDPGTEVGPLSNAAHYARVVSFVALAEQEGGRLLCGGKRPANLPTGYYLEPTAVLMPSNDNRVCQEEIFGPFAAFQVFDDFEDAIRIANASEFGLVSYLWSNDLAQVNRATRAIEAGVVLVNTPMVLDLRFPFGGYKNSGVGREGIEGMRHFYTEEKTVTIALKRPPMERLGAA
ncbi:aldehyde dehydrogenase [Hydrogenophaga sp.]|uniref:aldehyde dehydrogenase n=1 Tax=Hydrogenophaga sp. TaxID=1904254 RepID=UPI0035B0E2C5